MLTTVAFPKADVSVYNDKKGRHVCQRLKEIIPGWRFLSALDGEEYYYQQLFLRVPFRCEKDLLSDSNVSRTYEEECYYLRNLIKQEEGALSSLEDAAKRNFSIHYTS